MTTSSILKQIKSLPTEEQMKIVEKVIHALRTDTPTKAKRAVSKRKAESPSPSGDPWFDDPRNVAIVMEGIKSANEGKEIVLKSKDDIKKYFSNR